MRIHKLNSSVMLVILGLTLITFGFQNCTKARFVIDEAAKQKALDDGSVFDHGDDGQIPGQVGTTPGDDGSIPGSEIPGDDGSMPKPPVSGNDPSIPSIPGMPGNDPSMPKPPVTGNDPSMPKPPTSGNDTNVPAGDGSTISIVPSAVCGPKPFAGGIGAPQAAMPTTSKVVAVLFESSNFSMSSNYGLGLVDQQYNAKVIQAWDSEADITSIRAQLASLRPLQLKLKSALPAGNYAVVMFDASKVKAPYSYVSNRGQDAVAPIADSVVNLLDTSSTFKIDSTGKQKAPQVMNLLVGFQGDPQCNSAGSIDPLLIQLKTKTPQPIALTAPDEGVMFDLLGRRLNHKKVQTSWFASAQTENYFLALPNKDGQVLGVDELFGDATLGPDGKYAKQGFAALAKYDDTGDKVISEDDEVFSKLRLWKDENLDGIAQESELHTLESKGVVAIDLRFDRRYHEMDKHGNVTKYKSVVVMKDGEYGLVYDLYLRYYND